MTLAGTLMLGNWAQPSKAYCPMLVMDAGRLMVVRLLQPLNILWLMVVNPLGSDTLVKDEQPENALLPKAVSDVWLKSMLCSDEQPSNISYPSTVVRVAGMVTFGKLLQSWKAVRPNET